MSLSPPVGITPPHDGEDGVPPPHEDVGPKQVSVEDDGSLSSGWTILGLPAAAVEHSLAEQGTVWRHSSVSPKIVKFIEPHVGLAEKESRDGLCAPLGTPLRSDFNSEHEVSLPSPIMSFGPPPPLPAGCPENSRPEDKRCPLDDCVLDNPERRACAGDCVLDNQEYSWTEQPTEHGDLSPDAVGRAEPRKTSSPGAHNSSPVVVAPGRPSTSTEHSWSGPRNFEDEHGTPSVEMLPRGGGTFEGGGLTLFPTGGIFEGTIDLGRDARAAGPGVTDETLGELVEIWAAAVQELPR